MGKAKKVVVDTSVMVKWVNSADEKYLDKADKLRMEVKSGKVKLFAPELAKYELGNVLINKKLDLPMVCESLSTIFASPVKFMVLDENMADKSMEIAMKAGITFYDAVFLGLAERLRAIVITDNIKDMGKYRGVRVIDLKNY